MSNNKQSSIEWLETQLKKGAVFNPRDPLSYPKAVDNLFQQAKAMHKEEVTSFTADWSVQYKYEDGKSINKYYNETFGGNNEQQ